MAPTAQMRRGRRRRANISESQGAVAATPDIGPRLTRDGGVARAPRPGSSGAQHLLEATDGGILVDLLDGSKLAHQPIERRLVDLALAIGLLRLADIAVEVA